MFKRTQWWISLFTIALLTSTVSTLLTTPAIADGDKDVIIADEDATETWYDSSGDLSIPAVLDTLTPEVRAYMAHVTTLSNPFFEGRCPGTRGNELAAEYIEYWYRFFGLSPAFMDTTNGTQESLTDSALWSTYRQPFTVRGGRAAVTEELELHVDQDANSNITFIPGKDFSTLGLGQGTATGPITFVGYGIEEGPEGFEEYNSYGDADLTDQIALMFRFEPMGEDGRSLWKNGKRGWSWRSQLETKMRAAVERGATAIILVNAPNADDTRLSELMNATTANWFRIGVPVVQMSIPAADRLVRNTTDQTLLQLRESADRKNAAPVTFDETHTVRVNTKLKRVDHNTDNVGGVLYGKGNLRDEWIVIGGHYDHIGYGYFGSRGGAKATGKIHPGADDNASGTSAVILLAQQLTKLYQNLEPGENARSILFLAFTAEESGLHGSRYYVKHPSIPLDQIQIMINLDMVGRLRNDNLEVSGVGTAKGLEDLIAGIFDESGLNITSQKTGQGPSDHANFFQNNVPVLFCFTGLHDVYHTPADVGSTVNPVGAVKIVNLTNSLTMQFATMAEKLEFNRPRGRFNRNALNPNASNSKDKKDQQGQAESTQPTRSAIRVRFGIRPASYGEDENNGVEVGGVSPNTSAEAAGIQKDDLLVSWNGEKIGSIRDLMSQMAKHKPGDIVKVGIIRNDELIEVDVKLQPNQTADQ